MAAVRELRLELSGFETRALELEGTDGRDPIVLLHGFSDSADTWRPLMRHLAEQGRGALAVDLPGFGRAGRLARDRPILPQLDRFALAATQRAAINGGTGSAIVAGNSLGGCVSLRLAQRSEAPLAGIVPIAPAGLDMATWISVIEGAWAVQTILRSPLPLPQFAVRELIGQAYRNLATNHPGELDQAAVSYFTSHFTSKRDVVRLLGTGRTLKPELRNPYQLEWITCPVLVIWGDRDRLVHPSGAQRILREVPGSRFELFRGCGHCPQVECPERVAALLDEFPAAMAVTSAAA